MSPDANTANPAGSPIVTGLWISPAPKSASESASFARRLVNVPGEPSDDEAPGGA